MKKLIKLFFKINYLLIKLIFKIASKKILTLKQSFYFIGVVCAIVAVAASLHKPDVKQLPVKRKPMIIEITPIDTRKQGKDALAVYKDFIKKHEGYRSKPYRCSAGKVTIGYGHVIQGKEKVNISHEKLLEKDIKKALKTVDRNIKVKLSLKQRVALTSLTFNIGENAFKNSNLKRCINARNEACVKREFKQWVHVRGKASKGLKNRRQSELRLFFNQAI